MEPERLTSLLKGYVGSAVALGVLCEPLEAIPVDFDTTLCDSSLSMLAMKVLSTPETPILPKIHMIGARTKMRRTITPYVTGKNVNV